MRWIAGLGTGALMVVLAACGGSSDDGSTDGGDTDEPSQSFSDEPAEDIAKAAIEDMKGASSLRMAGDITNDGEAFTIDVAVTTAGDCEGSIALGDTGTAEILTAGSESWFRPDEAFWREYGGPQADQIMSAVGDKWVVVPPDDDGFSQLCDLDSFLDELDSDSKQQIEKGETEDVGGQEAIVLTTESDDGELVKAWIATDSPHYFLQMEVTSGDEPGQLTFTDFDEDFAIEAPPAQEVVDLNQMAG